MASKDKSGSNVRQDLKIGMTTTTTLSDSNDKVMYHTCHCPSSRNIEFLVLADNLMFPIDETRIAQSCKDERHQYRVTFIVGTSLRCSQMKCFITAFLEGMKKGMPNKFFVIQIAVGSYDFVWLSSKNGTVRIERRNPTDIYQELQSLKEGIFSFFPTALVFFYPVPDLSRALRTGSDSPNLEAENALEMQISKLNKKLQDCNESFFCIPGEKSLKDTWACKNVRRKYSKIWRFVSERRVSVDPKTGMYLNSFLHDSVFDFACCMFRKVGKNLNLKQLSKEKKHDDNLKSGLEKSSETEKACQKKQIPGESSCQDTSRTESKYNSDTRVTSSASELEQGELIDSEDETAEASERSESPRLKKGHSGHLKSSDVESQQSFPKVISSWNNKSSVGADGKSTSDGGINKLYRVGRKSSHSTSARCSRGKSSSSHDSPDRGKLSKDSHSDSLDRKLSHDNKDSSSRRRSSHSNRHSSHRDRKSSYSKSSDGKKLDMRPRHSSHRKSSHSDRDLHYRKSSKERDSTRGRRSSKDRESSERRKIREKERELCDRRSPHKEDRLDSRISSKEDRIAHHRRKSSSERYSTEKRSSKRDRSPSSRRNNPCDEKTSSDGRSDDTKAVLDKRRSRDKNTSENQRRRVCDEERIVLSSDKSVSPQSSSSVILLSQDPNREKSPASDSSRSTQIFSLNKTLEEPAHLMNNLDSVSNCSTISTSPDVSNPYRKDSGLRDLYTCHNNECKRYLANPYAHPDYVKEKKKFTSSWFAEHQSDAYCDPTALDWDWGIFWRVRIKELFEESWKMKKEIYQAQKNKARAERRRKRGLNDADFENYLSSVKEYSMEEKVQKWESSKRRKHSSSADKSNDSVSSHEVNREERNKIHGHAENKGQEKELKSCDLKFGQKESALAADCHEIDSSVMRKVIGSLVFPEAHRDPVINKLLIVLKVHPHLALLTASLKYMLDCALKSCTKMETTATLLEDEDNLIVLEMVQKKVKSLLEDKGNSDLVQDFQKALKATEDLMAMGKNINKPHFGLNLYSLAVATRGVNEDVLMCLVEGLALCSGRGEVNPQTVQQTCQVVQSLLK